MNYRSLGVFTYQAGEAETGERYTDRRLGIIDAPAVAPIMGITELWQCIACGAAIADRDGHDRWHSR